jgi:glycosyltransferase involved in cell wall biosynthesis
MAVSRSLQDELVARGFTEQRVVTIHNGIDIESMCSGAENNGDNSIRKEFNIAPDGIVLTVIALLRPRKGIEIAINAIRSVMKYHNNVHLLIVGDDSISEEENYGMRMRALASGMGIGAHVTFTGFRDDIPSILKDSDVFLLPSLFGEGLPMTVLEAMAMGVPVVASRVEGVPEVIDDGATGFLFNPGDVDGLANVVIRVLDDPGLLKRVSKRGQRKVLRELNGRGQAERVTRVYEEVLSGL